MLTGLGWILQSVLGIGTFVDFLPCTQTTVPSLAVQVGPGVIYSQAATDATSYGSVGTDATLLMKQGLNLTTQTLSLAAPTVAGQSQNYLIQVTYSDIDANPQVLSYFNSANPTVPYIGPGNTGTSQPTTRKGVCVISLLAGTAATTGTQVTPPPSAGYTGLYVVTLTYGQTTITTSQITTLATAPFITRRLSSQLPSVPTLFGLVLSNDGASPNTVFDIAPGGVIDKTGTTYIKTSSAFTKTLSNFAIGTGNGSLDTGTVASSRWYHIHSVYNPTTGLPDYVASLSYASPALPAGYSISVPIGAIYVNSSGNIMPFTQTGNRFIYSGTPVLDNAGFVPGASPMTVTLNVPTGVKVMARFRFAGGNGFSSAVAAMAQSFDEGAAMASINTNGLSDIYMPPGTYGSADANLSVLTNTSGQVRVSQSTSGAATLYTATYGFDYPRGA